MGAFFATTKEHFGLVCADVATSFPSEKVIVFTERMLSHVVEFSDVVFVTLPSREEEYDNDWLTVMEILEKIHKKFPKISILKRLGDPTPTGRLVTPVILDCDTFPGFALVVVNNQCSTSLDRILSDIGAAGELIRKCLCVSSQERKAWGDKYFFFRELDETLADAVRKLGSAVENIAGIYLRSPTCIPDF